MGQLTRLLVTLNVSPFYSTESTPYGDKVVFARPFTVASAATWYVEEFDPEQCLAFGYADLDDPICAEWA